MIMTNIDNESVKVLRECIELQKKKSLDYQNPNSRIRQADHYPRGINTIIDMVHQKLTRIYSLIEAAEGESTYKEPNFESIEDSMIDAINYLSFGVAYCRGKMDGQSLDRDIFNRKKKVNNTSSSNEYIVSVDHNTEHYTLNMAESLGNDVHLQNPASEIHLHSGISSFTHPDPLKGQYYYSSDEKF